MMKLTVNHAGHCRRRKIRCLLAPDDLHGRCSHCIRLKKECNFFPVDQQPQLERRPRSGSKNDGISNEASTSSSSSPALAGGHVVEQVESFNLYRPMPATSGPNFPGPTDPPSASTTLPLGKGSPMSSGKPFQKPFLTQMHTAPSHHRGFEFSHPPDRAPRWDSSYLDHSPASAGLGHPTPEDPSSAYWRFAESPMTPAFPHFSGHPSSSFHYPRDHGSSFSLSGSREDLGWPLPARSMSFGQVEDLPMNYQHHYHQPFQHDFRRRISTDMYAPPSLDTSNNSSISEPHSAPVSAPVGGLTRQHFGFPPAWNTLPGHHIGGVVGKGPESIGGWYSEPSPLAKVQEEDAGSILRGGPATFYSSAGHRPG